MCGYMKLIILYLLIVFSITPSFGEGILNRITLQELSGTGMAPPLIGDISNLSASNVVALKIISLSLTKPRAEKVFVIGEIALSQAAKNLANLSQEGPGIVEDGELTALYSTMSSAFSTIKIPINIFKYDSQNQQLSGDLSLGSGKSFNEQSGAYFQPGFPVLPVSEISSGSKDSRGGVTVIWNP
jgi:hypothetical protein